MTGPRLGTRRESMYQNPAGREALEHLNLREVPTFAPLCRNHMFLEQIMRAPVGSRRCGARLREAHGRDWVRAA